MGDDGIGVRVVEKLKKRRLPENVDVMDGATLSFQLLNFFDEYDKIIIVDAVSFGKKPGKVYRFKLEELLEFKTGNVASVHDFDVFSVVKMVKTFSEVPEIVIFGVEAEYIGEGIGLSEAVAKAVPKVIKKILREVTLSRGRIRTLRRRQFPPAK
jgi:hydrogenase maturation protease